MQIRVTRKFATDYKLKQLAEPQQTVALLDDWVIDVIRLARKKVAVMTHAKTFFTLLMPYSLVGGAKQIPKCIPPFLQEQLSAHEHIQSVGAIDALLDQPFYFCKTQSRQILAHMNDFKRCIETQVYGIPFDCIDWVELMWDINNTPINVRTIGCTYSAMLMQELLGHPQGVSAH